MRKMRSFLTFFLVCAAIAFFLQGKMDAKAAENGVILGYIYSFDGTTPINGAVIKVRNTVTGSEYQSTVSDRVGSFKITGIERGIYKYAVSTPDGEFVADSEFGVKMEHGDTAKLAINVTPYERRVDSSIADMPKPKAIDGETFIGRVVDFDVQTNLAEIFIMQGHLESDDKIHALGSTTDFYQKVDSLSVEDAEARAAVPGETALVELDNPAMAGDAVYVAGSSRASLAFLAPLAGVAAVVAGSSGVAYNVGVKSTQHIPDWCEPCSPFKPDDSSSVKKRRKGKR